MRFLATTREPYRQRRKKFPASRPRDAPTPRRSAHSGRSLLPPSFLYLPHAFFALTKRSTYFFSSLDFLKPNIFASQPRKFLRPDPPKLKALLLSSTGEQIAPQIFRLNPKNSERRNSCTLTKIIGFLLSLLLVCLSFCVGSSALKGGV